MKEKLDKNCYPIFEDSNEKKHRWMMRKNLLGIDREQFDKLSQEKGLVVHHIDEEKKNYRRDNLALLTQEAHENIHKKEWKLKNVSKILTILMVLIAFSAFMNLITQNKTYLFTSITLSLVGTGIWFFQKNFPKLFEKILWREGLIGDKN